jgi:cyclic pyranopterin phosphate synthase
MNMAKILSHIDAKGKPRMVDVSSKAETQREAVAKGEILMKAETLALIKGEKVVKGDVLTVAQIAGIMAAKQTPYLVPLCHPLLLNEIKVELEIDEKRNAVLITSTVKNTGRTGVEMEALTAVTAAALTIYDMCKAVNRAMRIENVRLIKKSGGRSGTIILE